MTRLARHALALALVFACGDARADDEPKRAKSPALVAGGVGSILFGVADGVGAGFLTAWATISHGCSDRGCDSPPYALLGVAVPMQLVSLGAIGGGIAMIAIGARRVPARTPVPPEGDACVTSAECGSLHCVEGVCRGLDAPAPPPPPSSDRGYVEAAVITDVCAVLTTIPPWMIAYASDFSRYATGFQLAPMVQLAAGPALHLFRGRPLPALVSVLGWSAVAATTYFVPTVVSPRGDEPNGLAAGTALLVGGGTAMTIVDALLARKHVARDPETSWAPSVAPTVGGAMIGLGGSW